MSQVDFYILSDPRPEAMPRAACELVDESWRRDSVYVHTASDRELTALDRMLWTWRQDSFIPHELVTAENADVPVLLGSGDLPNLSRGVLVNLSGRMPERCEAFRHIIEVIPVQEELRAAGRARFKVYREQGHALQTHNR